MNGVHYNGKKYDFEIMYPGCMGKMTHLNDKPHEGGSSLSRSRSNVSRISPSGDSVEGQEIVSGFDNSFPNIKSSGTPIKTLIAQEMSAEMDSGRDQPNLVAKLMGVDALPQREHGSTIQRSHSKTYEKWQKSPKPLNKGRYEETENERKMNLVRQKFVDAKRLSMDEKLHKSKQFQDALEVLSSNKDLLLKYLEEPNSIFSQHLHNFQSVLPPPPETKRITVLRPSNVQNDNDFAGSKYRDEKQIKRGTFARPNKSENIHHDDNSTEPTRIVILKPSPGKLRTVNPVGPPRLDLPNILLSRELFGNEEDDECRESRKMAKAIITQQMREKIGEHRSDETLISSVFSSDGYIADESSFDKSEIECVDGNLSNLEIERLGNPCSSSFTRASCSLESSVCREAKKRLSERWAMMASNGSYQEQLHCPRSSSTLGDMLAIFETKKEEGHCIEEPKNLMRSKSVPVFSTEFRTELNVDISVSDKMKPESPDNEDTEDTSVKSSFRGKVSGFFFSRNKKNGKNKARVSEIEDGNHSFRGEHCRDNASSRFLESNLIDKLEIMSPEIGSALEKPISSADINENHDHLSPNSVLDPHSEENEHGIERLNYLGPNLIDKSPPIGSIARTLSRDNSSSLLPTSEFLTIQKTDEEQECFSFVKTLLSVTGLHGEAKSNSIFARLHSPESPLDPSLRKNHIDYLNDTFHGAKQRRYNRKLVFDCVNEVLIDIAEYESESRQRAELRSDNCVLDEVWARIKVWFPGEDECGSGNNELMVERVVRNEVVGKGWNRNFASEMDRLGKKIGGELLEELVQETVVEMTTGKILSF